jgi:hypothetical protein
MRLMSTLKHLLFTTAHGITGDATHSLHGLGTTDGSVDGNY